MAQNTSSAKAKKKTAKPPVLKHVLVGDFYADHLTISFIKDAAKKAGVKFSTIYLEGELDYSSCYYEGDTPSVRIKVHGTK